MKPVNRYLLKLSAFLLLIVALQGCMSKAGSWKNDQIEAGKRADFHDLNNHVLADLKANDLRHLNNYMSKDLHENTYTERQVEHISNSLSDNTFTLLDEFYVVNKFRDFDTVKATGSGINCYGLVYPGTEREMYMAFFAPKASANKYLISLIYAKYNYGWKLSELDLAPYTINGQTATELFKYAKDEYNKKHLIEAYNASSLAISCLKPSEVWEYQNENDVHDFYSKLIEEANNQYKFPFTINQVVTKPLLIKVYNQTNDEGSFPIVYYISKIKLADTTAIKKENIEIRKAVNTLMPGLNQHKKYVLYSAFNQLSTGKKTVEHFDMTDKLQ